MSMSKRNDVEKKKCLDCGWEWVDGGEDKCPECDSDNINTKETQND